MTPVPFAVARLWRGVRSPMLALSLFLALLAGGPLRADPVLAPFEDAAALPPLIAALPVRPGRAYAVLVMIPPPAPVSLADPETVRRGVMAFLNPVATWRAGTRLGHAMIGWHCADGSRGLVGKTSDDPDLGTRMLRDGWGMAALLSEYRYGRLVALADLPPEHQRALRGPRVRVAAFEVPEAGCQGMRRALAGYLRHPGQPEARYTNLPDPARMTGDGCASFALWLGGRAGLFAPVVPDLQREIVLRDSFVGHPEPVPEGVIPFRAGVPGHRVGLGALILGDWSEGQEVARLTVLDPELMLAALDRAYARAGIAQEDRLGPTDPRAPVVRAAADRWLARYGRITPLRLGEARAIVLHRD